MSYFAFLTEHGPTLLLGTVTTIKVLVCSAILYVIISMIFGLMRLSKNPAIQGIATVYIEFFRGTSLLVQLFWVYYVLPFFGLSLEAFVAGVVALGMNFGAYGAEIVRAGILAVPKGQWEAARSLNYNSFQTWKNVILPQAIPPMIPPLANYLITMFKETPLLAAITVVELFRAADQYSNSHYKYLEPMTLVGVFFLIVSIPSAILLIA